jgi:pimeloyl-ACP methyl ester carboxylesterase
MATKTQYFERDGGRIAYDDTGGDGPLVLCTPGMGDLRGEYRFLAPELEQAGYRVVTMDLRGHGDSSTGWPSYSVDAIGSDIAALAHHLEAGPATLYGTSFAAGASVWASAEVGEVAGLVLAGPFVRDHASSFLQKAMIWGAFAGLWKVRAWAAYYGSLYPSQKPADFDAYRARLRNNLAEPGRFAALKAMMGASQAASEARLAQVQAPVLVVMGSKDPDFKDPRAEAGYVAERLSGTVLMIDGAGHYPHAEMPEKLTPALLRFLAESSSHG